jgi:hypothetical protein
MPSASVRPPAIDALPRQAVRDPDYWLLALAVLLLFACGIQLLIFPFGRSQASHALLGRAIVAGYLPVRDAWLAQAPGIGLLHAGIQATLGRSMMAFRAVETIVLVGAVLAATRVTKRWVGLERAGLLGGALFGLTYIQLEIEQTGQPEFFAGVLLLLAIAVCSREPSPRSSRITATLLGFLVGLVTLLVPCLAITVIPFAWLLAHREVAQSRRRTAPWLITGCVALGMFIPIVALMGWLGSQGGWAIFVRDWLKPLARLWLVPSIVDWISRSYHISYGVALRQSALLSAGILATFTLGSIHERESAGRRLLVSITVVAIMGLVAQRDDTPGTLSALLPLTSTLAGIGIYKAWRRVLTLGWTGSAAFAATAVLLFQMCTPVNYPPGRFLQRSKVRFRYLAGLAPYRSPEMLESELYNSKEYSLTTSRRVAAALRKRSLSNRDIWILGDDPQLAWLLADVPKLRFLRPVPEKLAQVAPWLAQRAQDEAYASAPRIIVMAPATSEFESSVELPPRWRPNYEPLDTLDSWRIFQRVNARAPAAEEPEFCDPNLN